jgi:hypothetical protein
MPHNLRQTAYLLRRNIRPRLQALRESTYLTYLELDRPFCQDPMLMADLGGITRRF